MSVHHQEVPSLLGRIAAAMSEAIGRVREDLSGADPVVRRSEHADFQCNAALSLAKRTGVKPRDLAADIVAALGAGGPIASAVPSGPGFLNVTVADDAIWEQVAARLADSRLGVGVPEHGRRTVVDYSAPNIAKEMHVGHLRTTIIGDSLARVVGFLGAEVVRQNHLGDFGTQFGMLIQYLDEHPDAAWHQDELGDEVSAVSALDTLYRSARAEFDADPEFADRARARVVALQSGDPATVAVWQDIVAESERSFRAIYDRLNVLLTPEDSVGESFYNPLLGDTVDELVDAGLVVESDGALVFYSDEVSGPEGKPVTLMVRKRDGGYGYDTTDLATIRYRIRDLAADRLVYVTDSRQALHFQLVFEAARRAGWLTGGITAEHVAYGTILGPDGRPFKTRAGGTVRLMDLLDAAVSRARAVVEEKNPELDAAELDRIAELAGIAAVKYADLSTSRVKDYSFDVDRMVSLTGNTGVYLQYAHARIRSILRKAGDPDTSVDRTVPLQPAERALGLELDAYGAVLGEVATTLEPHRLCGYLYDLARAFTTFYENCPVIKADEPVRGNRLALCRLTARTLGHGLDLLGIVAPERM
ncbi:arginyl-tRNA synthetase [Saccharothrix carnea]|uniref:Arginine--tRNA ligase n=1 Tax=Saccharothrix carnea TaxID=1280637 RepID=A0A2P8IFP7_SACCR|nr:arginine--tRNA ligase [Saccharothrix carnea]PSL57282.1 arginyl-tRNA synthetase [Saccharothrix carnea]